MASLRVDDKFYNFLENTHRDNIISAILFQGEFNNHINNDCNYISIVENKSDVVSYLPKHKFEKVDNPWIECRVNIKIGRFVKKMLTKYSIINFNINEDLIEKFVNLFKYYFELDPSKLKVVEGDDILKYYQSDNYDDTAKECGTLWSSCMRQKSRNIYLCLYSCNPKNIKMLIYLNDNGKIRARALLWDGVEDSNGNTYKIMDRIYYVYDHYVNIFKKWAVDNGYITKYYQNSKDLTLFLDSENNAIEKNLFIKMNKYILTHYPYLDTFSYFNSNCGILYNYESDEYDYMMKRTDGCLMEKPSNYPYLDEVMAVEDNQED